MAAPTTEIGYAVPNVAGNLSLSTYWHSLAAETTPELVWPLSVGVYSRMNRQDAQVISVIRAVTLPIRRTPWRIAPNNARDEVVQHVADDLGLPIVGEDKPRVPKRTRDRFSWSTHLRHALLKLVYGHAFFEQVYAITGSRAGQRAHLKKLAYRQPDSIADIGVARDGGLQYIQQYEGRPIPITQLVAYVNEQEGADWIGHSALRSCYKNWLVKDRLLRTGALSVERNGLGIPVYKGFPGEGDKDPGMSRGLKLATSLRSGDAAGAAIDHEAELALMGVSGNIIDPLPQIRYHDEQIARAVLAHVLNLGQQTGSWALGTTFMDFFVLSLQTIAQDCADVAQQHVVEDIVDQNWGIDEGAPLLVFDEIGSRQAITAQALKDLLDAGALSMDPALEAALRQQYGLPPRDPNAPLPAYKQAGQQDPSLPPGQQDPQAEPPADPAKEGNADG